MWTPSRSAYFLTSFTACNCAACIFACVHDMQTAASSLSPNTAQSTPLMATLLCCPCTAASDSAAASILCFCCHKVSETESAVPQDWSSSFEPLSSWSLLNTSSASSPGLCLCLPVPLPARTSCLTSRQSRARQLCDQKPLSCTASARLSGSLIIAKGRGCWGRHLLKSLHTDRLRAARCPLLMVTTATL